jgi:hypothetical protein
MGNSFFAYLQQLELMAFFSGYPLLYAIILFVAGKKQLQNNFKNRMVSVLPFAYALIGTLYLGLQLKKLHFNYSSENVAQMTHQPYLVIWGLLSILFWIPALSKRKELSLIHSLVFFFFLIRDIIIQTTSSSADRYMLKNDMRIYTISFLLNAGAFILLLLFTSLVALRKKDANNF